MPSAIAYYMSRGPGQGGNVSALPQNTPVKPLAPDPVRELQEKVRAATLAGRVNFLPYLDPYTEETMLMRRMYPVMLRHPVVKQALLTKVNSVAALDLQTVPAAETDRDHEIADFVRYSYSDALEGGFPGLAEEILLPGLIYKSSIAELVWYTDLWQRGQWIGKRFLRALKAKEYAQLVQDEFRNIVGVRAMGFGQAETFSPEDFAIFVNLRLFHGAGMSDLRQAYAELWQLDTVEKLHLIHLERFLSPVLSASYAPEFDLPANKTALEADLAAVRARGWIMAPDSVKITSLQLAVRGEAEMMDFKRDKREQIALSISGAFLQMLTSGGQTDIRGDSQTQQSTSELLVWALASKLTSILNSQVTPRLVNENYVGADYPKVSLGGINYAELAKSIEIDEAGQRMGAKLSARAMARKYSWQIATDQADVLTAPQTQAPAVSMPGLGGSGDGFADNPDEPDDDQDDCDGCQGTRINGYLMGQNFRDGRRRRGTRRFCGGKGGKPGPCATRGRSSRRIARPVAPTMRFADPASSGATVALHGHDGARAEQLLASAQARGARVLGLIARQAVLALAAGGKSALRAKRLFSDAQRQRLGMAIRDTMATAELLGRSRIRLRAAQAEANAGKQSFADMATDLRRFDDRGPLSPMAPQLAVDYFRRLVPEIGVHDVQRWSDTLERTAFTLAADADGVLLSRVQEAIRKRLETGEGIRAAPKEIARLLSDAGVAPSNAQYPEMVFRTNMMDAYNTGSERELAEVADVFPAWRYANPHDSRSRPEHAARNGRYYPSSRRFSDVRGTSAGDVCNCRCTPIPIDKWEWAELQQGGAAFDGETPRKFADPAAAGAGGGITRLAAAIAQQADAEQRFADARQSSMETAIAKLADAVTSERERPIIVNVAPAQVHVDAPVTVDMPEWPEMEPSVVNLTVEPKIVQAAAPAAEARRIVVRRTENGLEGEIS